MNPGGGKQSLPVRISEGVGPQREAGNGAHVMWWPPISSASAEADILDRSSPRIKGAPAAA